MAVPRILVVDDLLGRQVADGRNKERIGLCGQLLLQDVTGDSSPLQIDEPVAEAVFIRGQTPVRSIPGDTVENDLEGIAKTVRDGYGLLGEESMRWALVLLDLCFYTGKVTPLSDSRASGMPEGRPGEDAPSGYFGLRVLERLHGEFPHLPILILSAQDRENVSRQFAERGALGFLARGSEQSADLFREMLWRHGLFADPRGAIVGGAQSLLLALRAARRAAATAAGASGRHVLLRGDRGTGKELLAQFLNQSAAGGRERRLVPVDSGTLQADLWADALFGHRKGAFTGADSDRAGQMELAHGGDLFLDEIGNMPLGIQAGLLRALESGIVTRLGAIAETPIDVRVLSATNADIEIKAGTGAFRPDLLDRLREGGTIFLPPLRDRLEDVPILIERFVRAAEASLPGALARRIDSRVLDLVRELEWPDNVRGLKNCVTQAVRMHPDLEHLVPQHVMAARSALVGEQSSAPATVGERTLGRSGDAQELSPSGPAATGAAGRALSTPELAGYLPKLELAQGREMARYLRSVLVLTRKVTHADPDGQISIHRAMKFATGDERLSASKAADLIKRALGPAESAGDEVMKDPVLQEALRTARDLRPSRPRAKKPGEAS